jgi:hypothetical protein
MIYRTTKCPYCAYILEHLVPYAKELIGPPLAKCPSCHHPINTGMKYWSEMSSAEKAWYILRSVALSAYTTVFYTVGFCLVPGLILGVFVDRNTFNTLVDRHSNLIMWYAGVVAIGLIVVQLRRCVIQIGLHPQNDEIPEWGS